MKAKTKKFNPKSYNFVDIYNAYAASLIAKNPDYYSLPCHGKTYVKHYYIYKQSRRPIDIINYDLFREIIMTYFEIIGDKLIEGKTFNLMSHLGYLNIKRVERNPMKPRPDWGESRRYRKELIDAGEPLTEKRPIRARDGSFRLDADGNIMYKDYQRWMIYYTDDEYPMLDWTRKWRCLYKRYGSYVPNLLYYTFKPSISKTGANSFWNRVLKAIRSNPAIKMNYKYYRSTA